MTNRFDFLGNLFNNNSNNSSKKRADKQRRGRQCRIEELEGREMLSATPWSLTYDLGMPENDVPALEYQPHSNDADSPTDVPPLAPLAASSAAVPGGDWGIIMGGYTSKTGHLNDYLFAPSGSNVRSGEFTFKFANTGDANSYIKLWANGTNRLTNSGTWLELYKDGSQVARTNGETPTINLNGYAAGTYTVKWRAQTSAYGEFDFYIGINPPNPAVAQPNVSSSMSNATYTQGQNASSLSVSASSPGNVGSISYQWYAVGSSNVLSTSSSFTPPTGTAGTTQYYCHVINSANGVPNTRDSSTATITVIGAPSISTHPTSKGYYAGETATALSVAATRPGNVGTLSYQWQQSTNASNWNNIGTNSATLAASNISTSTIGTTYYRCVVTNAAGDKSLSTNSNTATITVDTAAPTGATISGSGTYTQGSAAKLSVTPTFPPSALTAPSYQWQSSTNNSTWNSIDAATSEDYIPPTSTAGTTYYRCVVTNSYGGQVRSTNSTTATITVDVAIPTITTNPVAGNYKKGQTPEALSIVATLPVGLPAPTYQWEKKGYYGSESTGDWEPISGATGATLSTSMMSNTPGWRTEYRCVVTNTSNGKSASTASAIAVISIDEENRDHKTQSTAWDFGVVGTPEQLMIGSADAPYYGVSISGVGGIEDANDWYAFTIEEEWGEYGKVEIVFNNDISELGLHLYDANGNYINREPKITKNDNIFTISISLADLPPGEYKILTENIGNKTNTYRLMVCPFESPVIEVAPLPATYKQDETATALSVIATGTNPTSIHQWQQSRNGTGWTTIQGAQSATYTPPVGTVGTMYYRCVVSNVLNGVPLVSVTSTSAKIVVFGAPEVTTQSGSATYEQGETASALSIWAIAPGDLGMLSYQWYRNGNPIPNATSATLDASLVSTSVSGETEYFCRVTNSLDGKSVTQDSDKITISVIGTPSISQQPQSITYWENATATLSITATPPAGIGSLSYQWYRNGAIITGATSATLAASSISTSAAGTTDYFCRITNSHGGKSTTIDSVAATVTVIGITEQPQSGVYAFGQKVTLPVTVVGDGLPGVTVEYTWQRYNASDNSWLPRMQGSSRTYSAPTDNVGTEQYRCYIEVTMNGVKKELISNTATIEVQSQKLVLDEVAKEYILGGGHEKGDIPFGGWTVDAIFKNSFGLYAEGLKNTKGEYLLVFRGTESNFSSPSAAMNSILDMIAGMDSKGIGYNQYMASRDALISWAFGTGSSLTVIGHSLGGALAQWFAADFTSRGGKLVGVETFNSTGIAKSTSNSVSVAASMFNSANCGSVKHHITSGDMISMFGEQFIDGTVYLYNAATATITGKHMTTLENMSLQKTITSVALSSAFFHYDGGEFLNTIESNRGVAALAPLLFFRCTAEGARSAIGKFAVDKLPSVGYNSITVPNVPILGSPGWALQDVKITWERDSFTVTAGLRAGAKGPTFGVSLGFVNYDPYINEVGGYWKAATPGVQLGTTPLYLQRLAAGLYNIATPANLSFKGEADFTIGPKVSDKWSNITIGGVIEVDASHMRIDGEIVVFDKKFFNADGFLEYNWAQQYLQGYVSANLYDGLATLEAAMKIWEYNGVQTLAMAGYAEVHVPKFVPLFGGRTLGSAGVGVYFTDNNYGGDDYVLVSTSLSFFGFKNIGAKFYFDKFGHVDVFGASQKNLEELKNLAKSPLYGIDGITPLMGPTENPNLLVLDWGYANENPLITFKLSDGSVLTEAQMLANGYIKLVEELSSDTRRVYGILEFSDIEIAQWEYALDGDDGIIIAELWGLEDNLDVQAKSITGGGDQPYRFDVGALSGDSNASPDTKVTIYLTDTDDSDYNGFEVWTTTLGELKNGGWTPSEDIASGTYSVYVVVEDGNKVPAKTYFGETITIGAEAPISGESANTHDSVTFSWSAVDGADDYEVRYRWVSNTGSGQWFSNNVTISGTTAVISGLSAETKYEFQVCAVSSTGNSGWSEGIFETTKSEPQPPRTLPAVPTGVTVVATTSPSALVAFWNPVDRATSYEIQYRITTNAKGKAIADSKNKNLWVTQIIEVTSPSVTVTGLKANTGYQFQVRAVNEVGTSGWSPVSMVAAAKTTVAIVTPDNPNLAKEKFSAKPKAVPGTTVADSATITWGTVPNATSYVLTYTIPSGVKGMPGITITKVLTGAELVAATDGTAVTYKIEGLKSSTTYKVSIFAQNASGTTTKAVTATVKTLKIAAPIKLASDKNAKPTVSSINLTWSPPKGGLGDDANGYIVEVWAPPASKGAAPELVQVIWVDKNVTSTEIKDLEKKTKYTFRLTYSTGSGLDGAVLDRSIESAVASKVISTAK